MNMHTFLRVAFAAAGLAIAIAGVILFTSPHGRFPPGYFAAAGVASIAWVLAYRAVVCRGAGKAASKSDENAVIWSA
jgi:hypothetical protein